MNVREDPSYFLTDQDPIQETDAPEQLHVQKDLFADAAQGMGRAGHCQRQLIKSSDQ
jgi:hypothetical protein